MQNRDLCRRVRDGRVCYTRSMVRKHAALCLMLLLCGWGCQPGGPATTALPAGTPVMPDAGMDYAVWSAVLAVDYPSGTEVQAILLTDLTDSAPMAGAGGDALSPYVREKLPSLDAATWAGYAARRPLAMPLQADRFDTRALGVPLRLISETELAKLFAGGGWAAFHQRYPGSSGIIALSLPGYNAGGTQALVHVSRTMGPLAGSGHLVLLQRDGTAWRVVATATTWIS